MKTRTWVLLLVLATISLLGNLLSAQETTLLPDRDACAIDPYQNSFFPVANTYEPEITGSGNAFPEQRCTMQFPLASIPQGQKIEKATFVLSCAGGRGKYAGIKAYGYVGGEQINSPDDFTDQTTLLASGPVGNDRCAFTTPQDITDFVRNTYKGGGKRLGITLLVTQNAMRAYYSRVDMEAPKLVIKYSKADGSED